MIVPAANAEPDSVRLHSKADLGAMPWFPWGQIHGMVGYGPKIDAVAAKKAATRLQ